MEEAKKQWSKWFEAALQSGIGPFEKFTRQKSKRLDGLVAHARWQINTGRLEGLTTR